MAQTSKTTNGLEVYQPGYEIAAERILELITSANYQAGDRLPTERDFAERLQISRSVVREALKILTSTGLVRVRKGSGNFMGTSPQPYVASAIAPNIHVDPEHMQSLFEFRLLNEPPAAAMAAERIVPSELRKLREAVELNREGAQKQIRELFNAGDVAFHNGIAEATHNPFIVSTIANLQQLQPWAIGVVIAQIPGSLMQAVEAHDAILSAIAEGNAAAAAQAMRAHIEATQAAYQAEIRRRIITATPSE